jgi:hypothetical protein
LVLLAAEGLTDRVDHQIRSVCASSSFGAVLAARACVEESGLAAASGFHRCKSDAGSRSRAGDACISSFPSML